MVGYWHGLERDADLHMAQLMPLPLTVSCFSKIQIGFTFLVPARPGSPGKRAVKRARARVCVCVCVRVMDLWQHYSSEQHLVKATLTVSSFCRDIFKMYLESNVMLRGVRLGSYRRDDPSVAQVVDDLDEALLCRRRRRGH